MTKIMSWNIENFDSFKISSTIQGSYSAWGNGLSAYIAANSTTTPFALLNYGVTSFPVHSNESQYLSYYNAVVVAATNQAVIATPTGNTETYLTTFTGSLTTAAAAFPQPNKWPPNSFINGLAAIAATGTISDVLYKIIENFFTITKTTEFSNFPLVLANPLLLRTNPELKEAIKDTKQEIRRQGSASPQLYSLNHINANINPGTGGTLLPDIIVVIEVLSENPVTPFQAIDGKGQIGIMELLTQLRNFNSNYCLVPPVRMGGSPNDTEGIAVFYNARVLQFIGPHLWNGTTAVAPSAAVVPAQYGGNWQNVAYPTTLPPAPGVIPGNALPDRDVTVGGVTCKEYQLAGQCNFLNASAALNFVLSGKGYRPPLLTEFLEMASGRKISLCSMHPNRGDKGSSNAPLSVAELGKIQEMSAASITGNAVGVFLGDFNTQLLNDPTKTKSYKELIRQLPYKLVFDNDFVTATPPGQYLATTLSDLGPTTFANAFPGYGYLKKLNVSTVSIFESLDNILISPITTHYNSAMILNRVVGVSATYASNNFSSAGTPTTFGYGTASILTDATNPYGCLMSETIESIGAMSGADNTAKSAALNSLENYGKIRATSDHMALIIDI